MPGDVGPAFGLTLDAQQVEGDLDDLEPDLVLGCCAQGQVTQASGPGGPDSVLDPARSRTELELGDRPVRGIGRERARPQGGGTSNTPDETLFAAIIYVLVSGCAWRQLPPCFGISKSTAHRRFLIWSRAGVWGRLHEAVLHRLDDAGLLDVTRVVLDTAHVRAKEGGEHTGPSPVDRGKPGSKMHILSDANGLPLLGGVSAGNTHDSEGLEPMIEGHQTRHDPHNGRYFKPQCLHADKAYDRADLRRWLRWKRIGVRIARKGIESSERLGRRRWVIERTMSWLSGYRRLSPRYERHPRNYLAFLGLAAALCCYKRLVRLTT